MTVARTVFLFFWSVDVCRHGPARQEVEPVLGWRAGRRAVGVQPQTRVGGEVEGFVVEGQVADLGMVEALGSGAMQPYVVRRPPGAELLAARRELADEV